MPKVQWGTDNFTKMVKEYGKKIELISDRIESEVEEFLNNCEEINLFKKELDKKKSKKGNQVTLAAKYLTPVVSSDTGVVYMSEDDFAKLADTAVLDDSIDDTFGDVELNKYQREVIKHVAEPYINKIIKQTGKNFARVALEFLTRGPGLTNFNFFDGILELIKEGLSTKFIDRIGEIYEKDYRFEKAYSAIMNQWEDKNENIDEELADIAENIDNVDDNDRRLLRNTLNMVAILMSDKYKSLITNELKNFYSNPNIPKLLRELAYRLNTEIDPTKDITVQAAKIYLDFIEKHKILESNLRPISNLYFMISSAISLSTFRRMSYRKPSEREVLRINRYIINRNKFLENTTNNNNSNIIIKYKDYLGDKETRRAFFDLVDTIELNFDDKLKVQEKLINLENKILQNIGDKPTGYPELDRAKNSKKVLSIFYGIE